MQLDDPSKPEFATWMSYQNFAKHVRHGRRFVFQDETQAFLDTVLATIKDRDLKIPKDQILCRAQNGVDYREVEDEDGNLSGLDVVGFGAVRMKPRQNRAKEGRVNPSGIPVLYLASDQITAISEIRAWAGSVVSVAQFIVQRDLRALNLTSGHVRASPIHPHLDLMFSEKPPSVEAKQDAVWFDIDLAFSRPVTLSDDTADYVPTQVLSELFWSAGYDAIIYRSHFVEEGYNIALSNVEDAEAINCAPYEVSGTKVEFEEIGSRWHSSKQLERKKSRKR